MRITLLGTGSPLPDPNRAGPSTLATADGLCVLIDCGRGVLMRLAAAGVYPVVLDGLLITHLHSDHICDLGDVITTRWVMSTDPRPLAIYGPAGTQEVVELTMRSLARDVRYRIDHHRDLNDPPTVNVRELEPGDSFGVGSAFVRVAATQHKPVEPTLAFRIECTHASAVLGGDGIPCDTLDQLCSGADAYVQAVIRDDLVKLVPNARLQDILNYHSTVEQAAQTATRAGVGTLVLTHYVPALQPAQEGEWRARAAAHFDGTIVIGDDLTAVEIGTS
ncbi:MAG: ribonuclease Z [Actinobacteria bacterium]|nr:ribonuclease Z [Actinomycetota bacterium]